MSETNPEQTESTESTGGDTNIEADQVVVNNAPDGGGIDNQDAPATEGESTEGESNSSE